MCLCVPLGAILWIVVGIVGSLIRFSTAFMMEHGALADRHYYELRLLQIPGGVIVAVLGILVDFPGIVQRVAPVCFMSFLGNSVCPNRWPLAVAGAVLASVVGAYGGVVLISGVIVLLRSLLCCCFCFNL
ncbi:unnamed protein product [Arabidopsis lyrata]|nr:unnamed protein product [Arabidopsis lyrata]